ncbi:MAG TPA: hypothetical protein VGE08_07185 [Steroidobacter sp.]|uniref:hypothetical protein n=1 Tax=Steroidobacter sp. TaxID=1978227 RepID=UPI002ED9E64D
MNEPDHAIPGESLRPYTRILYLSVSDIGAMKQGARKTGTHSRRHRKEVGLRVRQAFAAGIRTDDETVVATGRNWSPAFGHGVARPEMDGHL